MIRRKIRPISSSFFLIVLSLLSSVVLALIFASLSSHPIEAALLATSNGSIVVDANSGNIVPTIVGSGTGSPSPTLSITFNAPSNSSNSSDDSSEASFDEGVGAAGATTPSTNKTVANRTVVIETYIKTNVTYMFNLTNLTANVPVRYELNVTDMPITRISFTPVQDIPLVVFSIKTLLQKPSSTEALLNPAYVYIEITKSNLPNYMIKDASISFKVQDSWLQSQQLQATDVLLKRYTLAWDDITTVFSRSQSGYAYYESTPPGFSYFAIVSKRGGSTGLIDVTGDVISGVPEGDDTGDVPSLRPIDQPSENPAFGLNSVWTFVIVIVVLGVVFFAYSRFSGSSNGKKEEAPAAQRPAHKRDEDGFEMVQQDQSQQRQRGQSQSPSSKKEEIDKKFEQLRQYIVAQTFAGKSGGDIQKELVAVGWKPYVIDLLMHDVHSPEKRQQGATGLSKALSDSDTGGEASEGGRGREIGEGGSAGTAGKYADEASDAVLASLASYIQKSTARGYDDKHIREVLLNVGWKDSYIEEAFKRFKRGY